MKKLGYNLPKVLLASQSPRRRDLLTQLGVDFDVIALDVDETMQAGEPPKDYVNRIAIKKAQAGLAQFPDEIILAGDTIVVLDNEVFLKPTNREDHKKMLQKLSGKTHHVLTAMALASSDGTKKTMSDTAVTFRKLTEDEIDKYWDTGEPQDKSGGYASQGIASIFIERIEGSWSGVVGLPLFETFKLLSAASAIYR